MLHIMGENARAALRGRQIAALPIAEHLEGICAALKASRFLVLTAQTAAGKSTAVPIALTEHFPHNIIMTEPRRIAAVAVCSRVAQLLGEEAGETAGYIMKDERRVSKKTRLTVMTEGVLIRMLQDDAALEGTDVVVIDEAHERGINTDLALAFLLEAAQLRDDLHILVMSATIDTSALCKYLAFNGTPAPVINVPGRQYEIETVYRKGADTDIQKAAAMAASDEYLLLKKGEAELVFLPGIKEIRGAQSILSSALPKANIMVLHSSISLAEQKRVLTPPPPSSAPRIILSSAIAETSLTVPNVRTVIDCGLSRINRMNVPSGMSALVTETESVFSAEQRRGRAGRTGQGKCVRLWAESDKRVEIAAPEILRGDIMPLVLECVAWCGVCDMNKLQWLTPPSTGAWNAARELLAAMGLLEDKDRAYRVTQKGRAALQLPLHPRLACTALAGAGGTDDVLRAAVSCAIDYSDGAFPSPNARRRAEETLSHKIKEVSALLDIKQSEGGLSPIHCDYAPPLVIAGGKKGCAATYQTKQPSTHQCAAISCPPPSRAAMLLAGFPDRIARLEEGGDGLTYRFPSGRVGRIAERRQKIGKENKAGTASAMLKGKEWIVAPVVDAGERTGQIYDWEELDNETAAAWLGPRAKEQSEAMFESGTYKLRKTIYTYYGRIVLSKRDAKVTKEDYAAACCKEVKEKGLEWLPLGKDAKDLLLRAKFCAQHEGGATPRRLEGVVAMDTVIARERSPFRHCEGHEVPRGNLANQSIGTRDCHASLRKARNDDGSSQTGGNRNDKAGSVNKWLSPFITGTMLTEKAAEDALRYCLDGKKIDRLAPRKITLPNGNTCRVEYKAIGTVIRPTVEVIIQRVYGVKETPHIMGVPITFCLLSPARRPLQVTDDLDGFWHGTWKEVAKEMRGRYPKHDWSYTP